MTEDPKEKRQVARAAALIEREVARGFEIPCGAIRAARRDRAPVVRARHVAMYLERILLELDYGTIGRRFGRHRTAIAYACRRIEEGRDDPALDDRLERLEGRLGPRLAGADR